jgi:hypothetical protein
MWREPPESLVEELARMREDRDPMREAEVRDLHREQLLEDREEAAEDENEPRWNRRT